MMMEQSGGRIQPRVSPVIARQEERRSSRRGRLPAGSGGRVAPARVALALLLAAAATAPPRRAARAECPPDRDCGPYGACVTDTRSCGDSCQESCKCAPSYYGFDCSFRAETCPDDVLGAKEDAHECLNGGTCYRVSEPAVNGEVGEGGGTGGGSASPVNSYYRCDCRRAYGDAGTYAGPQCEYLAEVSCEQGVPKSTYAFCVNGGRCNATVPTGSPFGGCACPVGYEGRHCQYPYGTAPPDELVYSPPPSASGLPPVAIFFLVVAAVAFVGGVAVLAWRRERSRRSKSGGHAQDVVVAAETDPASHRPSSSSASTPRGDDSYLHEDDDDGIQVSSSTLSRGGGGLEASPADREIL